MSAVRLESKGKQSSPGCLTLFRRELTRLPVYRADLNPPVLNAEHGKAASRGHDGFVVGPPARQGEQEQHWDDRRSHSRDVMFRISPRRSGLERQERFVDPLLLGNCNGRATPVAWCTQTCGLKEHGDEGRNPVLPNGSMGIGCAQVGHRFTSSRGSGAWKGPALERFEPCEAKVSRTVLRGAWAG